MRYPIAIEPGDEGTAFGVVVPDLPGCFSAGDSIDEAIINAEQAIDAWIETALDEQQEIPRPSTVQHWAADPGFSGWTFGIVTVDPAALDDRIERVNITLPRRVLHRLDERAKAAGESRSGYIARMALTAARP
ncbi:MAG TPA: type II toxin-antitoxin system HicB family antitoxin [Candidatus Luteimonas excrementigallinarum]|nr:type II toxin-antitoxin system HicB family antitoxin [Candidatus Luteimonas excrementigallinarum]